MHLLCLMNCYTYKVLLPGLVSFVVQVVAFFLQVELDPVVKTNDFCSRFCLSNKDMFESRGVQAGECFSLEIPHKNKTLLQNKFIGQPFTQL